jgi:chromosome segregation ATPase
MSQSHRTELAEFQSRLEAAKAECEKHRAETGVVTQQGKQKQDEVDRIKEMNRRLAEDNKELAAVVDKCRADNEALVNEYQNICVSFASNIQKLHEQAQAECKHARAEAVAAKAQFLAVKDASFQYSADLESLRQEQESVQREREELQLSVSQLTIRLNEVNETNQKLVRELENSKEAK